MLQRERREKERERERNLIKRAKRIKLNAALNQLWPKFITKINSLSCLREGMGEGGGGSAAATRSDKKCIINDVVLFLRGGKAAL